MSRIRLFFKSISEIVGTDDIGLLILVNEDESRQMAVPCDRHMLDTFRLRLKKTSATKKMLPEVLWNVLQYQSDLKLEVYIDAIIEGQYQAVLTDTVTFIEEPVRASDAILLSYVSGGEIPIYVDKKLFVQQSTDYNSTAAGISLPINTISDEMLRSALDKAISSENYEAASYLRDEIRKREKLQQKNGTPEEDKQS